MKKKFENPELILVNFANEDIILTSTSDYDEAGGNGGLDE